MKIGDKLYCKKSWSSFDGCYKITKGKTYIISNVYSPEQYKAEYYSAIHIISDSKHNLLFVIKLKQEYNNVKTGFLFYDKYFVTLKELRRQKLEKINIIK